MKTKILSLIVGLFVSTTGFAQSTAEYVPDYISNVTLSTAGNNIVFDIMRDRGVKLQLVDYYHQVAFDFIPPLMRWNNSEIPATTDFVLGDIELEPNKLYRLEYNLNSYFGYRVISHNPTNGFYIYMRRRNSPIYDYGILGDFTLNRQYLDVGYTIRGIDGYSGYTDWFNSTELAGAGFESMIELVMDLAH